MTTTVHPAGTIDLTTDAEAASRSRRRRLAPLALVPALWIPLALAHPVGEAGEGYESIRDQVGLWVGIHMLQPFLALGLAVGLWQLVRNSSLPSARVARIALPIWLVAFTAFDSVAGIASGLVVHHANGLAGADQQAVGDTVDYLAVNPVAGDFSVIWLISNLALLIGVVAVALTLRTSGAGRAMWISAMVGVLLSMHWGPAAAIGLAGLAHALHKARRTGLAT